MEELVNDISEFLLGLKVRYTHSLDHKLSKLIEENKAIPVCPELLGGFSTPREPAEIIGGNGEDVLDGKAKVVEKSGRDVTELYIKGAYSTLKKAKAVNATVVVLKEYSPSCGNSMIYNGEFMGEKITGNGVTTALLKRNGLRVISEEQLAEYYDEII
ncbi:DUF523 domain-containing protein [Agaribacter marinus]|uniref:DUF523 domain-containing protein n=1 Tax=Virgibacillus salarius TaxID=447199 RepID=A0A941DVE5_9BACI|nr:MULTISPECIES: DUF523 domain-containing protein [Bacillaceae]MBR7797395.1 DUF523 domain-containing protein [Virgibacillus salarius]MDY7045765.1 DUF523 domain-containing protein [Virgibacillus sp. M23]NAZ10105.1 DUF523 domain-containing protein [Agaribacter marinus]WBX79439.1 DUF523 domain-containing protein [Virgibacillus salarius]